MSSFNEVLRRKNPARHRQHQCHGQIGDILGQHAGRVSHRDAARPRRRNIDSIVADAKIGNELQARKPGEEAGRNLRFTIHHQHLRNAGGRLPFGFVQLAPMQHWKMLG